MKKGITIDPDICNGRPCVAGTRITVSTILDYLAAGDSHDDILAAYPSLQESDIIECLKFASKAISTRHHIAAAG